MKPWLSILLKILVGLVLLAFVFAATTPINPGTKTSATQTAVSTQTPVPTPTPQPSKTEQPAEAAESPEPTPEPAYIPAPDELLDFELGELPLTSGSIEYTVEYGSLVAEWELISEADYYVLYALDANDVVYHKDILWSDIDSWTISGIRQGSLLLLGYKDMGEKTAQDDELVKALYQTIVAGDLMFASDDNLQNKYYIIVDKEDFTMAVFTYDENGAYTKLVAAFPCATGRSSRMTSLGTFEISSKGAWKRWNSKQYSPYYTKYTAGLYIHGPIYRYKKFDSLLYKSYNAIGSKATSGCIRTTVEAAMWIYYECPAGTVIEVVESSDKVDHVEKIPLDENYPTWDPTDPDKPANEEQKS